MNILEELYDIAKKIELRESQNTKDKLTWRKLSETIRSRSQEISILKNQLVQKSLKKKE